MSEGGAFLLVSGLLVVVAGLAFLLDAGLRRFRVSYRQKTSPFARKIIWLWCAWAIIVIGFQLWASYRFEPKRPDCALEWTCWYTRARGEDNQAEVGWPYLHDPFLNDQVAWDSEYYLSIATIGYDDLDVPHDEDSGLALNYAFMPAYPAAIRLLAFPLRLFGLTPRAASILAGVLVSAMGTLVAMFSLYIVTRDELGDAGGLRAAFYLVVFPTGFFLVQVYTEGLFVGLAFASLALVWHNRLGWAAVLAACTVLTRSVGLALVAALAWAWCEDVFRRIKEKQLTLRPFPWRIVADAAFVLLPVGVYFLWASSHWGQSFKTVEENYFGRRLFAWEQSWYAWKAAFLSLSGDNRQTIAYYGVEFAAIILGLVACLFTARRYPGLTLFGFLVWLVSLASGGAQGMHRYVLGVPSIFLALSRWGKHEAFDRAWTVASLLLMAVYAVLFTFHLWAG